MSFITKKYTKIALALSILALILWCALGTGTTLAWFTDTSTEAKNLFQLGEFDLTVSHLTDSGYVEITQDTAVFDDSAVYEPGYVQVVYLKIKNNGTVPFNYTTAVNILEHTPATNVFDASFNLYEHLKFGFVTASTESELKEMVATRELAKQYCNEDMPLNTYSSNVAALNAKKEAYAAIIVRMPEAVGNVANYRGSTVPSVKLGLVIKAIQQDAQ